LTSIATSTPINATLTQRQGCRTGTALMSSGGTVAERRAASGGAVMTGCYAAAPLMTGLVIAPLETPHLSRIALYVPSSIRAFTPPRWPSLWVPAVFGIGVPYGAAS